MAMSKCAACVIIAFLRLMYVIVYSLICRNVVIVIMSPPAISRRRHSVFCPSVRPSVIKVVSASSYYKPLMRNFAKFTTYVYLGTKVI